MEKIILTLALFMTFSATAMANTCDQLPDHKALTKELKSVVKAMDKETNGGLELNMQATLAVCDGSAANSLRFAGLGGLFGNQKESVISVRFQQKSVATSSRFTGLGGLFGNQKESEVSVKFQQESDATSPKFAGLGGLFGNQRKPEISLNPVLASAL